MNPKQVTAFRPYFNKVSGDPLSVIQQGRYLPGQFVECFEYDVTLPDGEGIEVCWLLRVFFQGSYRKALPRSMYPLEDKATLFLLSCLDTQLDTVLQVEPEFFDARAELRKDRNALPLATITDNAETETPAKKRGPNSAVPSATFVKRYKKTF